MGRPTLHRALPPLSEACAGFDGFAQDTKPYETITELLRRIARGVRRSQQHPFYSVRQVADFFRVSTKTVVKAYRQLSQEGVLVTQRGSQTFVPPRTMRPRIPVRAVVAMPVWMPGLYYFPHWRLFFGRIDEELRRHNFVADFIFFGDRAFEFMDVGDPAFADRILARNPDVVLWNGSDLRQKQAIQIMGDRGTPVILLSNKDHRLPEHRYILRRTLAIGQCLEAWKRAGIEAVQIPRMTGSDISTTQGRLTGLLAKAGLKVSEAKQAGHRSLTHYIHSLSRRGEAIFFDDDLWCQILCRRRPEEVSALFGRTRVAVMDTLGLPADLLKGVRADVLHHDYKRLAKQVADELNTGAVFVRNEGVVMEAQWYPRAEIRRFAQEF